MQTKSLSDMTDEELATAYVEGNNRAFDMLLARYEVPVFSYITFMVHDEELANDIFQETFIKVILKLQRGEYVANGKFGGWITCIARNVIIDNFRANSRHPIRACLVDVKANSDRGDNGEVTSFAEAEIAKMEVWEDIRKMVDLLPPLQKEVVYMHYYCHLPFREIAKMTNVSINTSLGRMRYAILSLRKMAKKLGILLAIE